MRCPKCHYLSFEPEPRCKNCGYGLQLDESDLLIREPEQADAPVVDIPLRSDVPFRPAGPAGPAASTRLSSAAVLDAPVRPSSPAARVPERSRAVDSSPRASHQPPVDTPPPVASSHTVQPGAALPQYPTADVPAALEPAPFVDPTATPSLRSVTEPAGSVALPAASAPRPKPAPTSELPLFVKALTASEPAASAVADEPLVVVPKEPRPPLAVRRPAPETTAPARPRPSALGARKLGPLDRDLLEDLQRIEKLEKKEAAADARQAARAALPADRAGANKRLAAAAIDATLLGGLSAVMLWVILRWSDLPLEQALALPMLPTGAFLLMVGLSYLLMFTAAGGQTIGKMLLGIRVIGAAAGPEGAMLTFKQALYRETLALPSILVLGAGFVPALMGEERALHDRLAQTRVVRV